MNTMQPQEHESGLFTRRTYLKAAGIAVLGTAATSATAAAEYETVTVPEDEHEVVEVGDSETLENVLFDVTAAGAAVTIVATGTDWTIRNIAVHGQVDMGDNAIIGAADTDGGTSRIENVWLGDGSTYEENGTTGIWVDPDHDGHLEIDRVNVQEMSDNAFYCSAPGTDWGSGGTVDIENCYAANCWVAHYRLAEGTVENCVASVTDDRQYRQGRGIWAWPPGPVDVRDCHLDMNGAHYSFVAGANGSGSRINVSGTEWDDEFHGGWRTIGNGTVNFEGGNGNDPKNIVPEGCPSSAEEAVHSGEDEPSVDDYRDECSGKVETEGIRRAIDDWRSGRIGIDLLRDVIDAWQRS